MGRPGRHPTKQSLRVVSSSSVLPLKMASIVKDVSEIVSVFAKQYGKTPKLLRIVDCYVVYALATAAVQFAYMFLVGSFPFNAFLAGFLCNVGLAVLAVCLRMQLDTVETSKAMRIEDVYFDFCVASIFLFFIAISYVG